MPNITKISGVAQSAERDCIINSMYVLHIFINLYIISKIIRNLCIIFMKYLILFFISTLLLLGCAQVIQPTGGQADKLPPQLVSSNPENKT